MTSDRIHKTRTSRLQRLGRLIRAALDPRAYAHAVKVLNYYNYTHVAELRKVTRGQGVSISPTASFSNGQNIVIGDRVHVGANTSLWAGPGAARIEIGSDALIAPSVMVTAASYRYNDGSPVTDQAMNEATVRIGRDVWLGYGAVVLAGVTIGDGAIIGAGAVVRTDIPANAIVAGNPAAIVGQRRIQS
ncbi:acyltransferase [Defluviimonas sp. WL0024]|uniref:Acyltransferase n=2 Tax=Albidovulum TaxID=205889 RepID=A0ABT3J8N9_9RHOB|nr:MULTISPECIES: acyltransferase [Defluviimonas]MCU9848004.1 acyltransferase [Defluviimonas sp. WL0024]MCW3783805.1 acyltransferase [Defluviimonas salinarum]